MAEDYIRRSDVLEFSRIFNDQLWETGGYRNCITEAVPVSVIKNIPSADVLEVRHGKWVEKKGVLHPLETDGICTECGYETGFYNFFNFCPNCGARMDG